MEKQCKKCGTTDNVNFDGMCKKCYEDSIVVHEKTEEQEKVRKSSFWRDRKNVAIVVLSFLLFCVLAFSDTDQADKINELNAQIERQNRQVAELEEENKKIETLEANVETLSKEKEDLNAKLSAVASTEDLKKTIDEKSQQILNLESQIGSLAAEKAEVEAQNGVLQQQLSSKSSTTSSTSKSSTSSSTSPGTSTSYTVYITNTGSKYHRSGCSYLRSSSHAIDKNSAVSQGYTACSRCSP